MKGSAHACFAGYTGERLCKIMDRKARIEIEIEVEVEVEVELG